MGSLAPIDTSSPELSLIWAPIGNIVEEGTDLLRAEYWEVFYEAICPRNGCIDKIRVAKSEDMLTWKGGDP